MTPKPKDGHNVLISAELRRRCTDRYVAGCLVDDTGENAGSVLYSLKPPGSLFSDYVGMGQRRK